MRIKLKLNKDVNQNAAVYFEKAKKARKKYKGAEVALGDSIKKLSDLKKRKAEELEKEEIKKSELENKKIRKKEWYEKFRWFHTSEDFLVVCGRDATSNEIIVKKHTDPKDILFHTESPGSPFCVIKTEGKQVGQETLKEVADFTATFSKAWKLGLTDTEVFWVEPSQVSKEAQSGEYLKKGAFMIYGKKNILRGKVGLVVGFLEERIIVGPKESVEKQTKDYIIIEQGRDKKSDVAKQVKMKFKEADLDEIMHHLPSGGLKIRKTK